MSEEIRAKIRKHMEEMNKGNIDAMDDLLAPDVVRHQPQSPDIKGLEASKQVVRDLDAAFPDRHEVIDEIIVEGDTSVVRLTFQGTHTGPHPLMPPPTGKQVTFTMCMISHWEGGKVIEDWLYLDMLGMMQQLGAIPSQ